MDQTTDSKNPGWKPINKFDFLHVLLLYNLQQFKSFWSISNVMNISVASDLHVDHHLDTFLTLCQQIGLCLLFLACAGKEK